MNRTTLSVLVCSSLLAACSNQPDEVQAEIEVPAGEQFEAQDSEAPQAAVPSGLSGPVLETMSSGGYTYARVGTTDGEVWAAAPATMLAVGQVVEIKEAMAMPNFESPSLGRKFDLIYFASSFGTPGEEQLPVGSSAAPVDTGVSDGDVAPAEGGQTVEQVITNKADFIGQEILVRARVVKFTPQILGKNWIHIQDGTGSEGTNDLTVTTDAEPAVGDLVLMRGILVADKDFGYGYKYDLIVEDAQVTVE